MNAESISTCPLELDFEHFGEQRPNVCYGKWSEYAAAAVVACFLPVLRFLLDRTLFQALLGSFIGKQEKLVKAKESAWKFCVYVSFVSLALWASVGERWFSNTWHYWSGCMGVPCGEGATPRVNLLYVVEMAYYMEEIPMLFIWATRRKDFVHLLVHHFATLGLIVYSLELGITRVGTIIFLLHDVNDPFMEIAKVVRYTGRWEDLSLAFFVLFVLSWFVSRVYYFPVVVIRSTLFEVKLRAEQLATSVEPHYTILNSLLMVLLVLHVYWSYLILKIIYRQIFSGKLSDSREDDDSDKED